MIGAQVFTHSPFTSIALQKDLPNFCSTLQFSAVEDHTIFKGETGHFISRDGK